MGGKSLARIHLLGRPHTRGGYTMVNRPTTRGALEPPLYSPTPGLTVLLPSSYPSPNPRSPLVWCGSSSAWLRLSIDRDAETRACHAFMQ